MAGGDFVWVHGHHSYPWNWHFCLGYLLHIYSKRRSQINPHFGSLLNGVLLGACLHDSLLDQIVATDITTNYENHLIPNIENIGQLLLLL